ncbi:anaphase-promoting complex, subunit 10/DOC domain-containing protein [Entophlyctis helioformis]|nr:anaphase-promoting complex, subunit 10/DOC domain-containing protein [Entophlyctis helioformis]
MDGDDETVLMVPMVTGSLSAWKAADLRDITALARWSLSSSKHEHGVRNLLDGSIDTYWQSDGPQPHLINIHLAKAWPVAQVSFYVDIKQDESYTPQIVSLRAGNRVHDLAEVGRVELCQPAGWIDIPVSQPGSRVAHVFMLQLAVLANDHNGKDTHVRQVRVWAERESDGDDSRSQWH